MQGRRRIAVVIPKYGLPGGAEGFAAELTGRIANDPRFEIHVFANRWIASSDRITFHKVPIIGFPRFLSSPSFAFFAGRKIAATGPFALIHTHDRIFKADIYTMHGVPHRWWIREVRKKRMSLFDRALAGVEDHLVRNGGCSRFLAVSGLVRDIFVDQYKIDKTLVDVIHPGIETAPYEQINREMSRREIRKRYNIKENETLILFVSMNFAIKGLDYILRGIGSLKKRNPGISIRLLVLGHGDEKHYRKLASELGIADLVIFTGTIERKSLPDFYLAGDLFAMLSRFDTFGMVVLEAMAAGLPVLISGRVGAKDLVTDGQNGFVIEDPADSDLVAGRIETMLSGEIQKKMRIAALETARENTWDAVVRKVIGIYEMIEADQSLVNSNIPHP